MKRKVILLIIITLVTVSSMLFIAHGFSLLNKIQRRYLTDNDEELGIRPETQLYSEPETKPSSPKEQKKELKQDTPKVNLTDNKNNKDVKNKKSPAKIEEKKISSGKRENKNIYSKAKNGILNIALFGLDARQVSDASRSDCIMVLSIDQKDQKLKITSIMRDTYINVPGRGKSRVNSAYFYGGPLLAIKTLNTNFQLDIRNYVTVNFFGLEKLIDKMGGVNVNINSAEAKQINSIIKNTGTRNVTAYMIKDIGNVHLNGKQAVAYTRIRYVGDSDFERTERQRYVLNQLFKKIKTQGTAQLTYNISSVLPYVETNMSNSDIFDIAFKVMSFDIVKAEQLRIPVNGTFKNENINGAAVLVLDMEKNKKLLHKFIYNSK